MANDEPRISDTYMSLPRVSGTNWEFNVYAPVARGNELVTTISGYEPVQRVTLASEGYRCRLHVVMDASHQPSRARDELRGMIQHFPDEHRVMDITAAPLVVNNDISDAEASQIIHEQLEAAAVVEQDAEHELRVITANKRAWMGKLRALMGNINDVSRGCKVDTTLDAINQRALNAKAKALELAAGTTGADRILLEEAAFTLGQVGLFDKELSPAICHTANMRLAVMLNQLNSEIHQLAGAA